MIMEKLLGWLGADIVPFPLSTKCCGGMAMTTHPATGRILSGKILKAAVDRNADCIATACPLCQTNLECYQADVHRLLGTDFSMPIVYFTQLLGLALGVGVKRLGLGKELISTKSVLSRRAEPASAG